MGADGTSDTDEPGYVPEPVFPLLPLGKRPNRGRADPHPRELDSLAQGTLDNHARRAGRTVVAWVVPISGRVSVVGTSAVQLDRSETPLVVLAITNTSSATSIDVGGLGVSSGNGYPIVAGQTVTFSMPVGHGLRPCDLGLIAPSGNTVVVAWWGLA